MDETAATLPVTLRRARRASRISQLELALRLGVSQRHVSFVETARARPSRPLLAAWLTVIDCPLAVQNAAMLQAGYAPVYGSAAADDPALAAARAALERLLETHDPMPAMVLDADWTVLQLNRGALHLAGLVMPALLASLDGAPLNMLDALQHPLGPAAAIANLDEVGPSLLAHLRREATMHPALAPRVERFAAFVEARTGAAVDGGDRRGDRRSRPPSPLAPVLETAFATAAGPLRFFSMFTTFGTPQDINLASLRVEHMFPADETTAAAMRAAAG